MQLTLLPQAGAAWRAGKLGDAAVLKAVALSPASYPEVEAAVRQLDRPLPDLVALTESVRPVAGTLGWYYTRFLQCNGITPLLASAELLSTLGDQNLVAARYVLVHDAFHVLLGFDISRCGELAVWSFVAAQRYNPAYTFAAALAHRLYPLLEPRSRAELEQHRQAGLRLGAAVPCLIAQPIESYWALPLEDARRRLGIPCEVT